MALQGLLKGTLRPDTSGGRTLPLYTLEAEAFPARGSLSKALLTSLRAVSVKTLRLSSEAPSKPTDQASGPLLRVEERS